MNNQRQAIKEFCKAEGITNTALAAAYGVSDSAMSQFLNGGRPIPDMGKLVAALSSLVDGYVAVDVEYNARDGEITQNGFHIRKGQ